MAKSKKVSYLNNATIVAADGVAERHEQYIEQFVTRAHTELYALLADMMQVCLDVTSSPLCEGLLTQMKQTLKDKYSLRVSKNTTPVAVVIRYITRAHRKTVHTYKRVIEVAISQGIAPCDLSAFIANQGGIEKVRAAVASKVEVEASEKAIQLGYTEMAHIMESKQALGAVNFNSSTSLPHATDVGFTHLLCKRNLATGKLDVFTVLYPSATLEREALAQLNYVYKAAAASKSDCFYETCKNLGLKENTVLTWMASNGYTSADDVRKHLESISRIVNEARTEALAA